MEPDLFKALEKVGQSKFLARAILSRYGTGITNTGLYKYPSADTPVDARKLNFI
jgi:hypothetical protein